MKSQINSPKLNRKGQFKTSGLELSRKGQFEIFGLAMVIVLVIVALLFVFLLMPTSEPSPVLGISRTEIGANTINSLLKTTTNCQDISISELVENCVDGLTLNSQKIPTIDYCPGSQNSCQYGIRTIESLLESTLGVWNMDYQFYVSTQNTGIFNQHEELTITTGASCIQKEHFEQLIRTPSGLLTKIELDLC